MDENANFHVRRRPARLTDGRGALTGRGALSAGCRGAKRSSKGELTIEGTLKVVIQRVL
jgi:hypothetical protein